MKQDKIFDALYEQQFAVDLSIRYHNHMINTMTFVSNILKQMFCIIAGIYAGVLFAMGFIPELTIILVVANVMIFSWIKSASNSVKFHTNKRTLFYLLKKHFPKDLLKGTEELTTFIRNEREDIEKDDTKGFPCLDVICHNDVCIDRGLTNAVCPLTWVQRNIGRIIPINYR